jgi:hypothetical protein
MAEYHPLDKERPTTDVTNEELMQILSGEILPRDVHWQRWQKERVKRMKAARLDFTGHLKTFHTRELMQMHRDGSIQGWANFGILAEVSYSEKIETMVRAELATREHIPNKTEAKALRRAAATKHHGPRKRA